MSTKVGFLRPVTQGTRQELHGEINTLQMQLKIKLIPNNLKNSDGAPDFIVCATGISGAEIQLGAAWKKLKSQIGDVNYEFLSITIDDPSLPNAMNVAAFMRENGDWDITFRRPRLSLNQPTAA